MADILARLEHSLDMLLGQIGLRAPHELEAVLYLFGAALALGLGAAVRSAVRIAFLSGPARR